MLLHAYKQRANLCHHHHHHRPQHQMQGTKPCNRECTGTLHANPGKRMWWKQPDPTATNTLKTRQARPWTDIINRGQTQSTVVKHSQTATLPALPLHALCKHACSYKGRCCASFRCVALHNKILPLPPGPQQHNTNTLRVRHASDAARTSRRLRQHCNPKTQGGAKDR